jgi:6-phosphogluconolactonase
VIFLVSGPDKTQALARLMDPQESEERTPARLVRPTSEVIILADAAAAANLS